MDEIARINGRNFWLMLEQTMSLGRTLKPRGLEIREIEDLQLSVSPRYPFMTFKDRNYSLEYFKKEMLWKLTANKYDESIMKHAKMWESVQNPDGTFNSNYGQFWFGEQNGFWNVVQELVRDPDSRRAVIPMLTSKHLSPETIDTVCTECLGFRIRDGSLNMSAHMRSSDQIFGLGTDIPTFAFLYRLVLGVLQISMPNLTMGKIAITAMSSHIYARHYAMVDLLLNAGVDSYEPVTMPMCTGAEAIQIVSSRGKNLQNTGELGSWLAS